MRALVVLGAAALTLIGVALATPIDVLAVGDGRDEFVGVLSKGQSFDYRYRNSVYDAVVVQRQSRHGDRIDLTDARSADLRALEYLRWDSRIRSGTGIHEQAAPPIEVGEIVLRITAAGEQRLGSDRWTLDLLARFGDGVVTIRPTQRPLLTVLAQAMRR
ncbi:hypothetical protein BH18CHL2_BH18CHL2_01510 [soil metagenome]